MLGRSRVWGPGPGRTAHGTAGAGARARARLPGPIPLPGVPASLAPSALRAVGALGAGGSARDSAQPATLGAPRVPARPDGGGGW